MRLTSRSGQPGRTAPGVTAVVVTASATLPALVAPRPSALPLALYPAGVFLGLTLLYVRLCRRYGIRPPLLVRRVHRCAARSVRHRPGRDAGTRRV